MEQREFSLENLLLASQENHNQETSTVFTQIVSGPLMPAVFLFHTRHPLAETLIPPEVRF